MTSVTRSMTMALAPLFTARQSLDPALTPDERFDLLSIPAYDTGTPEVVGGIEIGSTKLIVHPGDTLISKIVPHIQRVWVVPPRGSLRQIASSEWIVLRSERTDPSYLRYVLLEQGFHSRFMATVDGLSGSLQRARPQLVRRIEIPVPPLREQRAIADFLDRETAQIDAFIAKNAELIALLTERRAAFVDGELRAASATTASMPLKRVVAGVTVGIVVTPSQWYTDVGVPALRGLNVAAGAISTEALVYLSDEGHRSHLKSELRAGDVVVVRTGQAGAAAVVPPELDGANAIDLLIIRPGDQVLPDFLAHYLNSETAARMIAHGSVGSIQGHFNVGALRELPMPPLGLAGQGRVVERIESATQRINGAIATAQRAIDLARERRAALISAAVTGKIDVGVRA